MADALSLLDRYLCCHLCSETFRDPVSLGCHHSFCSSCLSKFWDQTKNKNCPVCKRKSSKEATIHFSLKTLADCYAGREKSGESREEKDGVEEEDRKLVCTKHNEEPKWFCEVEQKAVCHVCETPVEHRHPVIPIQQTVKDLKGKLTSNLQSLQSRQEKCKDAEKIYNEILQYSKKQLVSTDRQIRGEFEKLHQFLKEEEEARLAALREEEEEKEMMITREMKNIQDQITSLTENITAVKQELQKQEVPFLKSYKHIQTSLKAWVTLPDPQPVSGGLIDVAKHLGNLRFRVWQKMQKIIKHTPVILDPNTASSWLSLSEDLISVKHLRKRQQLPDNPERNTEYANVLGSEGFSSGIHHWDVEVGDHPDWSVGVVKESINRKGKLYADPKTGLWAIQHMGGSYMNGFNYTINLTRRLQRIRVQLDCDQGEVSFYDPKDMTHIYTHKDTFTEKVIPYFSVGAAGDAVHSKIQICQSEGA